MRQGAMIVLVCALACANKQEPKDPAPPVAKKVALVVMDGFGLGEDKPGNAIAEALRRRPAGFLARALAGGHPMVELEASGVCAGLPEGVAGNSEAGHNNLCAADVVPQRRTVLDELVAKDQLGQVAALEQAFARVKAERRPLHVIGYLAEESSVGHYGHTIALVRAAQRAGVVDVQLHLICDGSGQRSCRELLAEVHAALPKARIATVVGREQCFDRTGPSAAVRACVDALRSPRPAAAIDLDAVLVETKARSAGELPARRLRRGAAIGDDDTVIVTMVRRDDPEAMVRVLRERPTASDPVSPRGPLVLTLGELDERSRYTDDPRLFDALQLPRRDGFLHEQIAAAGLVEARLAEKKKAAHVTYFCDGGVVNDGPTYRRFIPASLEADAALVHPCLRSEDVVRAAKAEVDRADTRFVLMNLPNADLLGHMAAYEPTVQAVECLDRVLGDFVEYATARGYAVFVTADHGNADEMLRDGVWHGTHSDNPVPFIAMSPRGAAPFVLDRSAERPCLFHVSWTVLDTLGLLPGNKASLLAP